MMRKPRQFLMGAGLLLLAAAIAGGCHGRSGWVNTEQELALPAVGLHTVSIKTDSGGVQVRPTPAADDNIHVHAVIRASGRDDQDAVACLDSIEIATPTSGSADSVQEIRWAWKTPKRPQWNASVSFEVAMPAALDLQVESQNGKLDVAGVTGACELKSKNGGIRAWAVAAQRLTASTTNGELDIESPASQLDLSTTNGRIQAALTGPAIAKGRVEARNGEVKISVDPKADVGFQCKTNNGRITNRLPLRNVKQNSKRGLVGQLGEGSGTLEISTQNGNIRLEPIDPRKVERSDADD